MDILIDITYFLIVPDERGAGVPQSQPMGRFPLSSSCDDDDEFD